MAPEQVHPDPLRLLPKGGGFFNVGLDDPVQLPV